MISPVAYSQDFQVLLEAVDKIDINLKDLIAKESKARAKAIKQLQKQVTASNQSSVNYTEIDLETLVNDVALLKVENERLRELIQNNKKQFVSTEPVSISPNKSEYDELNHKLIKIDESLKAYKEKQHSKEKKSKTTVKGKLFTHGMADFSDGSGSYNEFALSRAYVTLKSKLSSDFSLRITSDLKPIDHKYNIILKYAYLDWSPSFANHNAKLRFGMQPTQYIDNMNALWGRRYVEKTVSDMHHFITSSDLGISSILGFGSKSKYGFASFALLNGTSYTDVQEINDQKDFNLVVLVNPFKDLKAFKKSAFMMQFYSGTQNEHLGEFMSIDTDVTPADTSFTTVVASDWKQQIISVGGLFAWNYTIDVGFDFNFATYGEGAGHDALSTKGLSFFGAFYLKELMHDTPFMKSLNFFSRVDFYDHDTSHENDSETAIIIGLESKPVKGFKMAINYRSTSFEDSAHDSDSKFYVNTIIKF